MELLLLIEGFRKPSGKKWRVPFSKDVKFNFDEFETLTEEEKSEELKKVLSKFLPIVQKVDRVLLDNRHLLKEWKEC